MKKTESIPGEDPAEEVLGDVASAPSASQSAEAETEHKEEIAAKNGDKKNHESDDAKDSDEEDVPPPRKATVA